MDDEDVRQDFLIAVDKFIAALRGSDEALAAFDSFWQKLNERLHAVPRSKELYELADSTALAIGTAAESLLVVEDAVKKNTDKLCEEAHILGAGLQADVANSYLDKDAPTEEQVEEDWSLLRNWFLANIAHPFVNVANRSSLAQSHEMDLDECIHWIQVIRKRSKWDSVYAEYADGDPDRMRILCEKYLQPLPNTARQQPPPDTKDTVFQVFIGMHDSVVKAWSDLWEERQLSDDWLAEAERRIALLPSEEEMEILGWDDEWTDFDWDALEALRKIRKVSPAIVSFPQTPVKMSSQDYAVKIEEEQIGTLGIIGLDGSIFPGLVGKESPDTKPNVFPDFSDIGSGPLSISTTSSTSSSASPPVPAPTAGVKRKLEEFFFEFESELASRPTPISAPSQSPLAPPNFSVPSPSLPTFHIVDTHIPKRKRLDAPPEPLPFTVTNIAASNSSKAPLSPTNIPSPAASTPSPSSSGSESGSPPYSSPTPPSIKSDSDTPKNRSSAGDVEPPTIDPYCTDRVSHLNSVQHLPIPSIKSSGSISPIISPLGSTSTLNDGLKPQSYGFAKYAKEQSASNLGKITSSLSQGLQESPLAEPKPSIFTISQQDNPEVRAIPPSSLNQVQVSSSQALSRGNGDEMVPLRPKQRQILIERKRKRRVYEPKPEATGCILIPTMVSAFEQVHIDARATHSEKVLYKPKQLDGKRDKVVMFRRNPGSPHDAQFQVPLSTAPLPLPSKIQSDLDIRPLKRTKVTGDSPWLSDIT